MDGGQQFLHTYTSVIVHNLDVECITILPDKTYSPLIIDANTVLSSPVAPECLQPITGWHPQVLEPDCSMQVKQPSARHTFDSSILQYELIVEQRLGILTAEGANHAHRVLWSA